jgi:hypothetical protein
MSDHHEAMLFAYHRGVRDFVKGEPSPPKPKEPRGRQALTDAHWHWIGWRVACGSDFLKRRAVWQKLGDPTPEPQIDSRA